LSSAVSQGKRLGRCVDEPLRRHEVGHADDLGGVQLAGHAHLAGVEGGLHDIDVKAAEGVHDERGRLGRVPFRPVHGAAVGIQHAADHLGPATQHVVARHHHAAGVVGPHRRIVGQDAAPPLVLGVGHKGLGVRAGVDLARLERGDEVTELGEVDEFHVAVGVEPRLLQGVA